MVENTKIMVCFYSVLNVTGLFFEYILYVHVHVFDYSLFI